MGLRWWLKYLQHAYHKAIVPPQWFSHNPSRPLVMASYLQWSYGRRLELTVEHFVGNNSLKEQGNGAKRLVEGYHGGESIGYLRFRLGRHTGQLSILYASGTE